MNNFFKVIGAVAIINIIARLFGFFREMVIGFQYGSGAIADSIFTAYMIPNFLYLVVGGAFTTAVISILNRETTDKALFVKQSFTIVLFTISILTIIMLVFTNPIIELFNSPTQCTHFLEAYCVGMSYFEIKEFLYAQKYLKRAITLFKILDYSDKKHHAEKLANVFNTLGKISYTMRTV